MLFPKKCLDIIQASAGPSASLPRAKRSLPRTSASHVLHCLLPQTFRGAWFARFASASIGAERKVILSEVAFRSLCRLGLHCYHATWPLACKHGATLLRSFREASANPPRNTPAVLAFLACCWHLLFEQALRFLYAATPFLLLESFLRALPCTH